MNGEDFIAALEASTGREIWRKKRDERISWTTPLVVDNGGQVQWRLTESCMWGVDYKRVG